METNKLKEVILITSDEKKLGYKWEDNAAALRGIEVFSEERDLVNLQKDITLIGAKIGKEQVFVKDPFYPNTYVEISQAENRIFKCKIKFYKQIALLLGAKSFTANAEIIEQNKFTMGVNGEVSYQLVKVDAAVSEEQNSNFNSKYDLNSDITPIDNFDRQRGFEDAKNLVKQHNLENEIDIVGLIENNDPSLQSRETRQKVKLELTSELNDLLEMSFNINAMSGVFQLGVNFKKTTESIKTIILETEIIF
jgi:hypothetical protein